jgi:hypothetical protein
VLTKLGGGESFHSNARDFGRHRSSVLDSIWKTDWRFWFVYIIRLQQSATKYQKPSLPPVRSKAAHNVSWQLTYVSAMIKLTHMEKTQVYLRKEELDALRKVAARSRRSVAALVREAVRKVVLMPAAEGPIAIWDGEPRRSSLDHDSVHDEP